MPKTKPKLSPPDQMTYEHAYKELEKTVGRLEEGDLPLEEALTLFERGQALADRCAELLENAELKLRQLMPDEAGGYAESDFALDDEA
ncbi:MAG TPA: exodeoxyribonuclease VII small subunit [Anaerolineales bacterium]|nr:exodeoxyribonuclease VII small subunit [Anaerolineales bacterium]